MRRDNYGIPTLQKDGITYCSDEDKAEVLNEHFASVFTKNSGHSVPSLDPSLYPDLLPFEVTVDEVDVLLGELDPFKATGPDGIPLKLLKELAHVLAPSLALLFNASLKQGCLPCDWKTALVTPLFTKGNCSDPTNYRSVSLTSVCSKILERIIHSHIMAHLYRHNILTHCQYGFRTKHSTELQLLRTVHDFTSSLNEKVRTDAVLLDLSKAFDKVVHHYLILKLKYYGIRHQILQWISSFLNGCTQYVICNGAQSSPTDVISGVPQGTVLGPLLFLVYINDLPNRVVSSCSLFADDCLLYRQIRSPEDCRILQDDLLKWKFGLILGKWCLILTNVKFYKLV